MNPFTAITSKIFAGAAVALLVTAGILWFLLNRANATIEAQRTAIAECNAARAVQNAAIERAGQESRRQQQAFASALEAGQATIREAQGRVTIVRQTARNACDTPPQIMGAGL